MSNQIVGAVYQQIIDRVIAASQNDFEEFGIDQSTLDEMKQAWQEKLTELNIASFPWDPPTEPPRQPPTVPSNVKNEHTASPIVSQQEHVNFPNAHAPIKSERPYEPPLSSYPPQVPNASYPQQVPNGYPGSGSAFDANIAQQRAQALVNQRLHPNAPPHMHMHQQQQQHQPQQQHGQMPVHAQQQQQPQQQQQQQRMMPGQSQQRPPQPQQMQQMHQRPPPPNHVYPPQTDGAEGTLEDWNALLQARAAQGDDGPSGRIAADQLMRTQIDAMIANQDNGLGMPLSQMAKGKKRNAITRVRQARQATASNKLSAPSVAPFDGVDEDDEESKEDPDDAINSDLDDPEDELDAADNSDDDMIDYMLCTYDKVQRVKNKWKCTLKDGILTTNKREYLFHKANGEFEW